MCMEGRHPGRRDDKRAGLTISVVDPDPDYLGIEIGACNERFAGRAAIYAGLRELSDFASRIAGFPSRVPDQRTYEFGSRDVGCAGGFCGIRFRTIDKAGHAALDVDIEDDDDMHSSARFSIPVSPAAIDRFVLALRAIESARSGTADLGLEDR